MRVKRCVHKLVSVLSTNQIIHHLLMQKYLIQIVKTAIINTSTMIKIYQKYILLYCLVKIGETLTTTISQKTCPTNQSTLYEIEWSSTNDRTSSVPLCINPANEIAYRECSDGEWDPEPECTYIQTENPPQCPESFLEFDDICYTFTARRNFPSYCPFPDNLPFLSFIHLILDKLSEPVWVPVTRDYTNGLGFLRWVEASMFYKEEYKDYNYTNNILNKNCLVYNRKNKSTPVSCYEKHPRVCAYQKIYLVNNKACVLYGTCTQSTYSSKTKCFCKDKNQNASLKPAEFIEPYQNSLNLSDELCNFGLQKSLNGTYYWSTTNQEITYTYWSSEAEFDSTSLYGAVTPQGWVLNKDQGDCILIEREVSEPEVTLTLSLNKTSKLFIVSVMNHYWVLSMGSNTTVFCFTDAKRDSLLYRYQNLDWTGEDSNESTSIFQPVEFFPGYHWCEAFKFSNLEVVSTEKIFFREPVAFEFVAVFQVGLPSLPFNPLSSEIMTFLNYTLLKPLDVVINDGTYYVPRLMKIHWFDERTRMMFVNVHFSSNLNIDGTTSAEKEYQYSSLHDVIDTTLSKIDNVKMNSFLSTDFCVSQIVCYRPDFCLNWLTTSAYEGTAPDKFCFRADGNPIGGFCGGNFTDGVRLMTTATDCKVLEQSSISKVLLPIYNNWELITESDISKILTLETKKFNSLDVYMIAEIYKKYFATTGFKVDTFSAAINKALKINKRVLSESQTTTHATDKLLYTIDTVMMNYQDTIEIIENDYVFVLSPSANISGILVQSLGGVRNVTILEGDCIANNLTKKVKNLELAICLSPELKNQIDPQVKIAFTLFFNNVFFGEVQYPPKNVSAVFGVLLIGKGYSEEQFLPGPVTIIQNMHLSANSIVSCVSWFYDVNHLQGLWIKTDDSYNLTSYQVCRFWYSAHFALAVSFKEFNVTTQLEDLLGSSYLDSERITVLANVSQKYHEFNPNDVFLVGQVLDLVKNNSDNDLNGLAKLVNNLHRVKKPVLTESQENHKATDRILDNIDGIAKNCDYNDSEVLVTTDTFILLVSNFKTNDFGGLLLLESNGTLQGQVLRGNVSTDDIESYENFTSAILVSSDLRNQFQSDSKIIITVFFSDVLFNDNQSQNKHVSVVFGVVLPKNGNYSGPLSILYNASSTSSTMECAHWNYSTTSQNKSYWKRDNEPKNFTHIRQCDFWHTTHFALLLLNNNDYTKYDVLDWITTINSAISLISLSIIVLTAVLFKKWRKNSGNQILLNFSFTIIIQIVALYIAGAFNRHSNSLCTLIGVLLHYSIISEFCWMLIIAILQFKKFVKVFATSPRYLVPKACVLGWILPAFPVVLVVVLTNGEYVAHSAGLCFPSSNLGMYLGVWLPVAVIGFINFIIFIYIMYNVINSRVENRSGVNEKKHQWRLFVLLFFMLGLTWVFGFLSGFDFRIVFTYLFCFTATLQGFVVFLYFIVFNTSTREMYYYKIKTLCSRKGF